MVVFVLQIGFYSTGCTHQNHVPNMGTSRKVDFKHLGFSTHLACGVVVVAMVVAVLVAVMVAAVVVEVGVLVYSSITCRRTLTALCQSNKTVRTD